MNEFLTYEYVVEPPKSGKRRKRKIIFALLYVLYCAVWLFFVMFGGGLLLLPLVAVVPLSLWIIVFFTWRYTNPEYEYSITSGILTFSIIYGGRSRKKCFDQTVKNMEAIAPLSKTHDYKIDDYKPTVAYDGCSSHDSPDAYFALFENEDGEKCVFFFEATARALKILRHYNPKTFVTNVRY